MGTPYYPKCHDKDVWNCPEKFFRKNRGLIGGGKAAQMMGMSRVYFYQHVDELGLTVHSSSISSREILSITISLE
jgi:hypothetical protein